MNFCRCGLILAAVLWTAAPLRAQSGAAGTVQGTITDQQGGALPGAIVRATSPATSQPFAVTSDAQGQYRLVSLPPGAYAVSVELPGFATLTRENVLVRAGLNVTLPIELGVEGIAENVRVSADAPLLETRSAVQAVNISGDLERDLPLSGRRNWADFLTLTPGVATSQARFQSYYLMGASSASQSLQVDGADAGSPLQGSALYAQYASDTFADIQVKTGGVDASAPIGLGVVVNIASKSGTNTHTGTVGVQYQPLSWNASNTPNGQSLTVEVFQPEASAGGPIVRDRLWYYGSLRLSRNKTGVTRVPITVQYLEALVPGFEPFNNQSDGNIIFSKLTGNISSRHRLLGSYSRDVLEVGGAQTSEAAIFSDVLSGGSAFQGRLQSTWGSNLLTELSVAYNGRGQSNLNKFNDITARPVHRDAVLSGGRLIGTGQLATLDSSPYGTNRYPVYSTTIAGDVTYFKRGWVGAHDFRAGIYLQPINHYEIRNIYNNGGFTQEDVKLRNPADPTSGLVPFHRLIYDVTELVSVNLDSRDNAFYLQDAWRPTSRLTISAGVRVDAIKRTDKLFDVVTQDHVEVGPRFGLNYVLTEDQRNAVRATWNSLHDNLSVTSSAALAGASSPGYRDLYDIDLDGAFETEFYTPGINSVSRNIITDLDSFHQPYVNEWTAGYRRQLPGLTSVDVSVAHREYRDQVATVETNGIYDGHVFRGYQDESQNEISLRTSNRWNWPVVTSLLFQGSKQGDGFNVIAGYSRQWRHIEGTWQPNDPASFIQPEAFPNNRGIGGTATAPNNGLSGVAQGGNTNWADHIVNAAVSWVGPWQLLLATSYTYQSGAWSGPVVTRLAAPDPQFGPPIVRLSSGRLVSNPLATTVRFAYPTRGEGQIQLKGIQQWNIRAGKRFTAGRQQFEVAVDVFNVTNNDGDQSFQVGGNQLYSPLFGQASQRQFPRAAQLSAKWTF